MQRWRACRTVSARLKDVTNKLGQKRKDAPNDPLDIGAKGTHAPRTHGDGFSDTQLAQVAKLISESENRVFGGLRDDMVQVSVACVDVIVQQNLTVADMSSQLSEMKQEVSDARTANAG